MPRRSWSWNMLHMAGGVKMLEDNGLTHPGFANRRCGTGAAEFVVKEFLSAGGILRPPTAESCSCREWTE